MKTGEVFLDKTDDGKQDVLVVKPTLLARIFGKRIVIFLNAVKKLKGGK